MTGQTSAIFSLFKLVFSRQHWLHHLMLHSCSYRLDCHLPAAETLVPLHIKKFDLLPIEITSVVLLLNLISHCVSLCCALSSTSRVDSASWGESSVSWRCLLKCCGLQTKGKHIMGPHCAHHSPKVVFTHPLQSWAGSAESEINRKLQVDYLWDQLTPSTFTWSLVCASRERKPPSMELW